MVMLRPQFLRRQEKALISETESRPEQKWIFWFVDGPDPELQFLLAVSLRSPCNEYRRAVRASPKSPTVGRAIVLAISNKLSRAVPDISVE
jgi:hypothetical protein